MSENSRGVKWPGDWAPSGKRIFRMNFQVKSAVFYAFFLGKTMLLARNRDKGA